MDENVFQLLANGENIGIVYSESRAMRKALICLKTRNIQDIALALAIIRPVAREHKSAYFKDYNDYKAISEDINSNNSRSNINDNLKKNNKLSNYIVYDDDAIQIIQKLVKCSESDADIYRKAFAKGKWEKMYEFKLRLNTLNKDLDDEKKNLIFDQLCNLKAYSFCKSHAISYAKLVYALAYCKYYKPVEFWISALNNCNSSYRKWVYYRECAAVGIKLTRGYAPWIWDDNIVGIVSISTRKLPDFTDEEEELFNDGITNLDVVNRMEYFRLGYWCDEKFIAGCYLKKDLEPTNKKKKIVDEKGNVSYIEENIYYWRFKGLISNYRCCKTWKKVITGSSKVSKERNITFVTIGYDNAKYIDIVLYGKIGLGKCHILEGYGEMQDENYAQWLKVVKWKSVYI